MARQITEGTTLHAKEAEMAISQLKKMVLKNIMDGHTVMLGDLGYFYPSVSSTPSGSAKEVTRRNIKRIKLNFRVNEKVEKELQEAKTVFIEDLPFKGQNRDK